MENRDIKQEQLQVYSGTAAFGRLRLSRALTTPSFPVYYQIDLLSTGKIITAVAMQDGGASDHVSAYFLSYSTDGTEWVKYNEKGVVKVKS